ncbi:MAG: (d)CMP kinase [Rickettsiales bacterium]
MHSTNDNPQPATSTLSKSLRGTTIVPGDKSISHRALMLASQALGTTTIHGLLEGEDVLRTAEALRQCGVPITRHAQGEWTVSGRGIGGLHEPADMLDMGNAGTAARLMMGLLSTYPFASHFTGDDSLRKRPMLRVITPLEQIGATFMAREGGRLPLAMQGCATPMPISYTLPVASAQVKSAILLAGLNTPGTTTIIEKEATRDHTERMLRFFGIPVETQNISSPHRGEVGRGAQVTVSQQLSPYPNPRPAGEGIIITLTGQPNQTPADRTLNVPSDPSSAAFPIVAALLVPNSEVTVTNVCLNPLRTGLFDVLKRMGADLTISNHREVGGEPIGDITARSSQLIEVDVPAHVAPSMIDEYPILAVAAACATGKSVMRGLSELRVKESDRLAAIIEGLRVNGIEAHEDGDDLIVYGKAGNPPGGGTVETHFDHRIAMSFLILGLVSQNAIVVDDTRAIATSFPSFMKLMKQLGANFIIPRKQERPTPERRMVIAIDGPAASGKGSLARRVAYHFGLGYLDTGLLYRAVGMRVIYADQKPEDVAAAIAAARAINAQDLANPKLRGERIGQAASLVSAMPEVRETLIDYQHNFAASENGAVLDGRDIGTVICPNADYKFFITASLEARARRRHKELQDYGVTVDYQSVYDDLVERDARDATRSVAPMKPAEDAVVIDTSDMTMQEVFDVVMAAINVS